MRFYDVEVGKALAEIRDAKLYRAQGFPTFEAYCDERWGMSRQTAYQRMAAAEVVSNLATNDSENVKTFLQNQPSLCQALPLSTLSPDLQREAASRIDFATATLAAYHGSVSTCETGQSFRV